MAAVGGDDLGDSSSVLRPTSSRNRQRNGSSASFGTRKVAQASRRSVSTGQLSDAIPFASPAPRPTSAASASSTPISTPTGSIRSSRTPDTTPGTATSISPGYSYLSPYVISEDEDDTGGGSGAHGPRPDSSPTQERDQRKRQASRSRETSNTRPPLRPKVERQLPLTPSAAPPPAPVVPPRTPPAGPMPSRPKSREAPAPRGSPGSTNPGKKTADLHPGDIDKMVDESVREPFKPPPDLKKRRGHVYIVHATHTITNEDNSVQTIDVFKIGSTHEWNTRKRFKSQNKTCKDTVLVGKEPWDFRPLRNNYYQRVEKLVQAELAHYNYRFQCPCKFDHKEFFVLDPKMAMGVIQRWSQFARKSPWAPTTGHLKPAWEAQLETRGQWDTIELPTDDEARNRRWASFASYEEEEEEEEREEGEGQERSAWRTMCDYRDMLVLGLNLFILLVPRRAMPALAAFSWCLHAALVYSPAGRGASAASTRSRVHSPERSSPTEESDPFGEDPAVAAADERGESSGATSGATSERHNDDQGGAGGGNLSAATFGIPSEWDSYDEASEDEEGEEEREEEEEQDSDEEALEQPRENRRHDVQMGGC